MRKGIMSLLGGGKSMSRQKSKNMQQAEQASVKPPVAAQEAKTEQKTHEKAFVQTINVPKMGTLQRGTKRKPGIGLVRPHGKPTGKK